MIMDEKCCGAFEVVILNTVQNRGAPFSILVSRNYCNQINKKYVHDKYIRISTRIEILKDMQVVWPLLTYLVHYTFS
jgi:hypothetical protein